MEVIRDRDGGVIARSRNQAGIRRYVGGRDAHAIKRMAIGEVGNREGKLMILFADGSSYETNFASFAVLCGWVARWRNVYGAPILVNGVDAGVVSRDNGSLVEHAYPPMGGS